MNKIQDGTIKLKKRKIKKTYLLIILLILIVLLQYILLKDPKQQTGDLRPTSIILVTPTPPPQNTPIQNMQKGISIPIQDKIRFTSQSKYQNVSFVNPSENNCNFVVSLTLSNKKTIYKSKLIPPGMAIYKIELKEALKEGEFKNSILTYECYKEDGTKLNSAVFKVDIIVE